MTTGDGTFLKTTLEASFLALPDMIAEAQLDILSIASDIEIIEDELKTIRETAMAQVLAEKDDNGKQKHTNEESRKLALSRMLVTNMYYEERMEKARTSRKEKRILEINEEKLRNTFTAYQSIVNLRRNL